MVVGTAEGMSREQEENLAQVPGQQGWLASLLCLPSMFKG